MRLFRTAPAERPVTALLRHMDHRRFPAALKALRRYRDGPPPPPHALHRLGRWLAEQGRPKAALRPLRLFLDLYPNHRDRPLVVQDLARCLHAAGKTQKAKQLTADS